jgi:hypothetical protein
VVSESTARRYNNAYKKLLRTGFKKDEITVNMLHGNWYLTRPRYKGKKRMRTGSLKLEDMSAKTKKIIKRPVQLKKTRSGKKTVYYSPMTGKVVKPKVVKRLKRYSFKVCGNIKVHLYRQNVDNSAVSHVIVWNTFEIYGNDVRWKNVAQFDMWMKSYNIPAKLRCYAKAVNRIAKRYKFDHTTAQIHGSSRTRRQMRHTNQWTPNNHIFSIHQSTNPSLETIVYKDLMGRMDDIRKSLESEETQGSAIRGMLLERIYFFIKTSIPSESVKSVAQYQKGIYNVR